MAGSLVEVLVGARVLEQGIAVHDLFGSLHDNADILGQIEQFNVIQRSPVLTGAMISDVQYEANAKGNDDPELLHIFSGTTNQLDEWGRVYVNYQEGGALGDTLTNGSGNHQMYAQVGSTDLPAIQRWAVETLQGFLNGWAAKP